MHNDCVNGIVAQCLRVAQMYDSTKYGLYIITHLQLLAFCSVSFQFCCSSYHSRFIIVQAAMTTDTNLLGFYFSFAVIICFVVL